MAQINEAASEVARFSWRVPPDMEVASLHRQRIGEHAADKPEKVLIPGRGKWRSYDPIGPECPEMALFSVLAETKLTEAAVADFIRQYGFLGFFETYSPSSGRGVMLQGEPLRIWRAAIRGIRPVVAVWNAIQENDETFLSECLIWRGKRRVDFREPYIAYPRSGEPFGRILASAGIGRDVFFDHWQHGELLGPARLFVAEQINAALAGNVSPHLLFDETGTFRPYARPANLLGAIWVQFYEVVAGLRKVRRCPVCLQWFESERTTGRMHADCANRARQARFKARRRKAGSR